jgi:histone H3/H4
LIQEFAVDFEPPPKGCNGGTGLYGGEQDMFCFLIDPAGWTDIGGEAFAPGFFVWNSEVGCRTVGIETFWYQSVCQNHIVWDAVEVVEFSRKHTANVHEALGEIRRAIENLVQKRDQRRDGFVKAVQRAMETTLGSDAEEALKALTQNGIARTLAKEAVEIAKEKGRLTIFAMVDALTRIASRQVNAGERLLVDQKAAGLLSLAA